jgi:hypothetical protein
MEVKGFIKLPIKTYKMSNEEFSKIEQMERLGLSGETHFNNKDYIHDTVIYLKPDQIKCFKEADDGNVDVAIYDTYNYQRVFIKFENFINIINSLEYE